MKEELSVTFTNDEIEFILERCIRKSMRLEESHLEDTPCYELAGAITRKLIHLLDGKK